MSRRVVDELKRLPERERFVRGLRAFVGFRQIGVRYERDARLAGEPKYTFRKLAALAAAGLVGFSGLPVRLVGYAGLATLALAGVAGVALIVTALSSGWVAPGWAWVLLAVAAGTGAQLTAFGVIGEYVRRVFVEVKGRPTYIVAEVRRGVAADCGADAFRRQWADADDLGAAV